MKTFNFFLVFSVACNFTFAQQWTQVSTGTGGVVNDMMVYNNKLLAVGQFTGAGNGIAFWDGTNWAPFGQGVSTNINAIDTINGDLYAVGNFSSIDGVPANNIAKWDGSNWSALGQGTNGVIYCIAEYAGEIYVGGDFTIAGNAPASKIARWNGTTWQAVGVGVSGGPWVGPATMCVYNNELYIGGGFAVPGNNIVKWDGNTLQGIGTGTDMPVISMNVFNGNLYLGGFFTLVNNTAIKSITMWNGSIFTNVGSGNNIGGIHDMQIFNNKLYVVGSFSMLGGSTTESFSIWDGVNWTSVTTGVPTDCFSIAMSIYSIEKYGTNIYLGGWFNLNCLNIDNFIIYAPQTVSVTENTSDVTDVVLFPNPSNGLITLTNLLPNTIITIYNTIGELVATEVSSDAIMEITLPHNAKGIYVVNVIEERGVKSFKVLLH